LTTDAIPSSGRPSRLSNSVVLNAGLAILAVFLGAVSLIMPSARGASLSDITTMLSTDPDLARLIVLEIRLPRVFLGLLVGATLGLCGAALQGLLRNPLAEPGLIGVSGGAALGTVIVFYFMLASGTSLAVPIGGIVGAFVSLVVLYLLSGNRPSVSTLILAGVAINAFAGAMTSLALNFAPNPYAALEIVFWLMGSLVDRSGDHVLLVLPFLVLGWGLIASTSRALDALSLGEDTAQSLGFDPFWVKARVILGTGLAVGASVSVTGVIGFVGLVIPHLLRPLTGYQPSRLLLPSALGGAVLLTAADIAVRLLSWQAELRIGVVTALVGAPFFLFLIIKTRRTSEL